MSVEFWAVEVKSGETVPVEPGVEVALHLSQANLGEAKKDKGNDSVYLYVHIDGKKLVLGTLSSEKLPQQQFDLVFDRKFELSHNWKNGSVFFYGYKNEPQYDDDEDDFDEESDESDEEELELGKPVSLNNGIPDKAPVAKKSEQKVKIVEPNKGSKSEEDEDSSDESNDDMSEDFESGDKEEDRDEDNSNEESSDEDEETPKKVEPSKKRPAESATKTPASKKTKVTTPQKTDGKKGSGHVATPYPSKQTGKTPASKPGQQTPKSGGSHTCKSCAKSFGSEQALDSHMKAKHK